MTQEEKLKAMNTDEFAESLCFLCSRCEECPYIGEYKCQDPDLRDGIKEWLKSEVKEQ